jgi:hypothetical protein
MQTLRAFRPRLERRAAGGAADRVRLSRDPLAAIATRRPGRYEPGATKRRRNYHGWLTRPRSEMKREMANRRTEK